VAIHLEGGKDDGAALVEHTHGLVRHGVDGILEAVIFGIDEDADIVIVSALAEGEEALVIGLMGGFLLGRQLLGVLGGFGEQGIGGEGGGLENGVGDVRVALCIVHRAEGLLHRSLDALGGLLTFGRIVECRLDAEAPQSGHGTGTVFDRFSAHKLLIERRLHDPPQREVDPQRDVRPKLCQLH